MQFNRDASGIMTPLPKPSIDTGMGLERIAAVVQGKDSNYQTDLLRPLIGHVERLSRKPYGDDEEQDVSMRVIADHARAATFLITDGVTPSNEWRGYVLRRIMRRAMRHGRMLGLMEPFLWDVTGSVVELMGGAYPEVREAQSRVAETVRLEEERFAETLDSAWRGFASTSSVRASGTGRPSRSTASSCSCSTTRMDSRWTWPRRCSRMPAGRCRRRAWPCTTKRWRPSASGRAPAHRSASPAMRQRVKACAIYQQLSTELAEAQFLGYAELAAPARILALVDEGRRRREASAGETVEVLLDRTPAYAESGGQMGDTGLIVGARRPGAHRGHVLPRRAAHRPPRRASRRARSRRATRSR